MAKKESKTKTGMKKAASTKGTAKGVKKKEAAVKTAASPKKTTNSIKKSAVSAKKKEAKTAGKVTKKKIAAKAEPKNGSAKKVGKVKTAEKKAAKVSSVKKAVVKVAQTKEKVTKKKKGAIKIASPFKETASKKVKVPVTKEPAIKEALLKKVSKPVKKVGLKVIAKKAATKKLLEKGEKPEDAKSPGIKKRTKSVEDIILTPSAGGEGPKKVAGKIRPEKISGKEARSTEKQKKGRTPVKEKVTVARELEKAEAAVRKSLPEKVAPLKGTPEKKAIVEEPAPAQRMTAIEIPSPKRQIVRPDEGKERLARVKKEPMPVEIAVAGGEPMPPQGRPHFSDMQERVEEAKYYLGTQEKTFFHEEKLPEGYGDNRIVLMIRDPYWAYAYWEINEAKLSEARRGLKDDFDRSKLVLRVYDITCVDFNGTNANSSFDIDVPNALGNWYLNIGMPNRTFCIDIGYRRPDGGLFLLARSNKITSPRDSVSEVVDEEWKGCDDEFGKIFAASGGISYAGSSAEIPEMIKRRIAAAVSSSGVANKKPSGRN